MGVSGQLHAPTVLPPGKKLPVFLNRRLGQTQSQPGCIGEEENLILCWELNHSTAVGQPVVWSLCQPCYPSSCKNKILS